MKGRKTRGEKVVRSWHQRGIALVAVMWIVAALAGLVAGLVYMARGETQVTRSYVESAEAEALLDGLARMAAHHVRHDSDASRVYDVLSLRVDGRRAFVEIVPEDGLIAVNKAPPALIDAFFRIIVGMDEHDAALALDTLLEVRSGDVQGFQTPRGLVATGVLEPDQWAQTIGLVSTMTRREGLVNPLAAPVPVLVVLAGGSVETAVRIHEDRATRASEQVNMRGLDDDYLQAMVNSGVVHLNLIIEAKVGDGYWRKRLAYSPAAELFGRREWRLDEPLRKVEVDEIQYLMRFLDAR